MNDFSLKPLIKLIPYLLLIVILVLGYFLYDTHLSLKNFETEHDREVTRLTNNFEKEKIEFEGELAKLGEENEAMEEENDELTDELRKEKRRNNDFADQIEEISGTVEQLDKLSKTDKELLQKYSKVFFLNEHYIPSDLSDIPAEYLHPTAQNDKIHSKVLKFLKRMFNEAEEDGIDFQIISAYRSFGTQAALKQSYRVTYGSGANQFSADQGYSEHQLGTTIDVTSSEIGANFGAIKGTKAYTWLLDNAHKYGFTLSYPEGNAYYQFEPWHWRFVGEELATKLHDAGKHFYDLDQREIDSYLLLIFE